MIFLFIKNLLFGEQMYSTFEIAYLYNLIRNNNVPIDYFF